MLNTNQQRRQAIISAMVLAAIFLSSLLSGCGGGGSNTSSPADFTLKPGNWGVPLPGGGSANGSLVQSATAISGTLHVSGSTCFDPIADTLMVTGTVSHDNSRTLSFTTAPIRGQVITVKGMLDGAFGLNRNGPPFDPQPVFNATVSISGGGCAGQMDGQPQLYDMTGNSIQVDFGGAIATATAHLTQNGPDAAAVFHVTGNWTFSSSPCFTTGTVTSANVQGSSVQMTINTDSGQLVGSGAFVQNLDGNTRFIKVALNFTVQGGTCNGDMFSALLHI